MITLRRAKERHHDSRRKHEVWLTFDAKDRTDPLADGFGALQILDEDRLSPGADLSRRPDRDAEIVTYVCGGALAYDDSMGRPGVIQAGEFRRTTAGRGRRQHETNASRNDSARVFQILVPPRAGGRRPRPRAEALQHGRPPGRAVRRRLARRAPRLAAHSPGRPSVLGDARPGQARRPRAARGAKRLDSPRRRGSHPRRPRPLERRRGRPHRGARGVAHGARRDRNPARRPGRGAARHPTTQEVFHE